MNSNYAQVADMVEQGQLHWATDPINAVLLTSAAFDGAHQRLSDIPLKTVIGTAPIQGRWLGADGQAMGLPATFPRAKSGVEYQVVVTKDDGRSNPILLSWLDEDSDGETLGVLRSGTLIIRPYYDNSVQPAATGIIRLQDSPPPEPPPPTVGVWMVLT